MNEEEGIHNRSTHNELRKPETQVAVVQRLDALEQTLNRTIDVLSGKIDALFSIFSIIQLRHPLPAMGHWAVSPDFARILVDVILDRKPGLILELGSGASTPLCDAVSKLLVLADTSTVSSRLRTCLAREAGCKGRGNQVDPQPHSRSRTRGSSP